MDSASGSGGSKRTRPTKTETSNSKETKDVQQANKQLPRDAWTHTSQFMQPHERQSAKLVSRTVKTGIEQSLQRRNFKNLNNLLRFVVLQALPDRESFPIPGNYMDTDSLLQELGKVKPEQIQDILRENQVSHGVKIKQEDVSILIESLKQETHQEQIKALLEGLQSLAIDAPDISHPPKQQSIDDLAALLQLTPNLKALDLSQNQLCKMDATAIAAALGELTQLETLKLQGNWLGIDNTDNATAIATALEKLTHLKKINLSQNGFSVYGIASITTIAAALKKLTQLETLTITANDFGLNNGASARAIAPALEELTQLKKLNLGWNELGESGIKAIAPALQKLTLMQELCLNCNWLGQAGAEAIIPALKVMTQLKMLNLWDNELSKEDTAMIREAVAEKAVIDGET